MLEPITRLRTLVLDNQPHAIELLTNYIAEVPFLELVYSVTNPVLALQFMQHQPVVQTADPGDKQLYGVLTEKKGKIIKVQWSEILYIESEKRDVAIHSCRTEPIRTSVSITDVETALPASQFMRVHKSFIVNLEKIDYIEGGRIFLASASKGCIVIPLGRTYRTDFFRQFKLLGKRENNLTAL